MKKHHKLIKHKVNYVKVVWIQQRVYYRCLWGLVAVAVPHFHLVSFVWKNFLILQKQQEMIIYQIVQPVCNENDVGGFSLGDVDLLPCPFR